MKAKTYKISLIGDTCVGKSSLVQQYINKEYSIHPYHDIGVHYKEKSINYKEISYIFKIQDISGKEKHKNKIISYSKKSDVAIFMYDITNKETFDSILNQIKMYDNSQKAVIPILLGNKLDLQSTRVISNEDGTNFAEQQNMLFMETSSISDEYNNINYLFDNLIQLFDKSNNKSNLTQSTISKQSQNTKDDKQQYDDQQNKVYYIKQEQNIQLSHDFIKFSSINKSIAQNVVIQNNSTNYIAQKSISNLDIIDCLPEFSLISPFTTLNISIHYNPNKNNHAIQNNKYSITQYCIELLEKELYISEDINKLFDNIDKRRIFYKQMNILFQPHENTNNINKLNQNSLTNKSEGNKNFNITHTNKIRPNSAKYYTNNKLSNKNNNIIKASSFVIPHEHKDINDQIFQSSSKSKRQDNSCKMFITRTGNKYYNQDNNNSSLSNLTNSNINNNLYNNKFMNINKSDQENTDEHKLNTQLAPTNENQSIKHKKILRMDDDNDSPQYYNKIKDKYHDDIIKLDNINKVHWLTQLKIQKAKYDHVIENLRLDLKRNKIIEHDYDLINQETNNINYYENMYNEYDKYNKDEKINMLKSINNFNIDLQDDIDENSHYNINKNLTQLNELCKKHDQNKIKISEEDVMDTQDCNRNKMISDLKSCVFEQNESNMDILEHVFQENK